MLLADITLISAKLDGVIEVANVSCQIFPAARESFKRLFKGENYTLANWHAFSATQPKPNFIRALMSLSGDGSVVARGGGGSAGEQLTKLVHDYVEEQRVKFGRTVQAADVAPIVWRKHPELARAWHEEMQY